MKNVAGTLPTIQLSTAYPLGSPRLIHRSRQAITDLFLLRYGEAFASKNPKVVTIFASRPVGGVSCSTISASVQSISLLWQKEEKEMAEPKDWKSWLPDPNVWKSWMLEPKAWKSWTPEAKGRRSGMSQQKIPNQGVVKQD
jgi:hypothetical protein